MIRREIVGKAVMNLYRNIPVIAFPFPVQAAINMFQNCRYQSYRHFAELNRCTITDVIRLCESKSGCTQYDIVNKRYLVLVNESENPGRVRWTSAHELGHILCGHFVDALSNSDFQNSFSLSSNPDFETEADVFASAVLSPLPLFDLLDIRSRESAQAMFGLSSEASGFAWDRYVKAIQNGVDFSAYSEFRNLFHQKRPQDEVVFDVAHHAVQTPPYMTYHNESVPSSFFGAF